MNGNSDNSALIAEYKMIQDFLLNRDRTVFYAISIIGSMLTGLLIYLILQPKAIQYVPLIWLAGLILILIPLIEAIRTVRIAEIGFDRIEEIEKELGAKFYRNIGEKRLRPLTPNETFIYVFIGFYSFFWTILSFYRDYNLLTLIIFAVLPAILYPLILMLVIKFAITKKVKKGAR